MTHQIIKLIICLLLANPLNGLADENKTEDGTLLNVSATEFIEVSEDLLVANLHYEFEAATAKEVHNQINVIMARALE